LATPQAKVVKVLTVNIHKGFTALNRHFMLHELREAVRAVSADVVFLQEVAGSHSRHASRYTNYPADPHHEFLADRIWPQHAYGRNAAWGRWVMPRSAVVVEVVAAAAGVELVFRCRRGSPCIAERVNDERTLSEHRVLEPFCF
jgi:endonuclease/exonuclease/phosphatase family metal-dependent hydrolase